MDSELLEFLEEHKTEDIRIFSERDQFLGCIKITMVLRQKDGPPLYERHYLEDHEMLSPFFRIKTLLNEMYDQIIKLRKGEEK